MSNETTTPTLAPCPHCGGGAYLLPYKGGYVRCATFISCDAMGPTKDPDGAKWNALAAAVAKGRECERLSAEHGIQDWGDLWLAVALGKLAPKLADALLTARDYMGERVDAYEIYATYPQDCSPGHKWARFSKDWEEVRATLDEYDALTATTPTKEATR